MHGPRRLRPPGRHPGRDPASPTLGEAGMALIITDTLTPDEVRNFRRRLERAPWRDGAETAGSLARRVKHNEQLDDGAEPALSLSRRILHSLDCT